MKSTTVLLIMSVLILAAPPAHGASLFPKVVGGVEASPGEFPYIVSFQVEGGHFCGGSLIRPSVVLTAAHCMGGKFKVAIGLHDQKDVKGVEQHEVKRVVVHPSNDPETIDYDFALVELAEPSNFPPVMINEREIEIPGEAEPGIASITAGWGATSEWGGVADRLRKVDVPLVSKERCKGAYGDNISDRMICAGYDLGKKDSCQGDSGGPLIVHDTAGTPVLVGVVSWGEGCARPGKFGVYAKINSVADWISAEAR